jgi:PBP1b-binding outer membrane lipoprotein LpoB
MAVAALALLLTGCSQVAALAPVGGNRPTEIRFAAIDVLVDQDVELGTAPTCTMADDRAVSCTGSTATGEEIAVTSSAADQASLEVTVAGTVIYSGPITDVIEKSIRP